MKALLLDVLLLLTVVPAVVPQPAYAGGYIYTPGQPVKIVSPNVGGYTVYHLGGGGNTVVRQTDPLTTMVQHGGEPPTFIHSDPGSVIQTVLPVSPSLDIEVE